MAVTKRTRFEVLRRDNYTCRYCRSTEEKLTIDHVTPVALGGSDDPSNLVAACKDCNAGKSSASPDAVTVAEVNADALRHAELIQAAYAVIVERLDDGTDYVDEFAESYTYTPLPSGWRESVRRWFEMGVPIEMVVAASNKACGIDKSFQGDGRFRYMCAIVWSQVRDVSEEILLRQHLDGKWMTEDALTNERIDGYEQGIKYERARLGPFVSGALSRDIGHRYLEHAIEGSNPWVSEPFDPLSPLRNAEKQLGWAVA